MKFKLVIAAACMASSMSLLAQEVTYRNQVKPMIQKLCAECHGDGAPTLAEFKLAEEKYKKEKLGPNTSTYENLLQIIAYTDTGAFMRRLDDGTNTADKKPGNMYKYLGETEQNLAHAFRDAEQDNAVLLIDEVDSFLQNRESATRSWEVSQVNELLQQMERFDGIFICATNLFDQIDAAALRRFAFKIAFKALLPEQRIKLFVQEALDGIEGELNTTMRNRLLRLDNLAPGDFAVVKRQAMLLGEVLPPSDFLAELESECRLKPGVNKQAMGFLH